MKQISQSSIKFCCWAF